MYKSEDFEAFIKKNFLALWTDFLDFEIQRSLKCIKFMGSPNAYVIMQIIAWNQHLTIIAQSKYMKRDDVREQWFKDSKQVNASKMKFCNKIILPRKRLFLV